MPTPERGIPNPFLLNAVPFWVNLTGYSGGVYQWKLRVPDAANPGKFTDDPSGATGDHAHTPGDRTGGALVGQDVRLQPFCINGGTLHFLILDQPAVTIEVTLTKDGGVDGDDASAPSYTYTPQDLSGNPIKDSAGNPLTTLSPTHNRPHGKTMVATQGELAFLPSGTIALRWTDEAPNFGPCTPGGS